MFKQLTIARAHGPLNLAALISNAGAREFVACGPTQQKSFGFVPPRAKGGAIVESVGGAWIAKIQIQTKSVPAAEVKKRVEVRLDAIERETGRRPKGKAVREIKDEVILELLPKAFAKDKTIPVWIDMLDGLVAIGAASATQIDEALMLLSECLLDSNIRTLSTRLSPAGAMATWLTSREAPPPFTIDRELELKQPDGEKAVVKYSRHTLDLDEVVEHINQGKAPTSLALTRDSRVSFTLTEGGALKKINILDVALENTARNEAVDAFDADVAIATGELRMLIDDLIEALGGEIEAEPVN